MIRIAILLSAVVAVGLVAYLTPAKPVTKPVDKTDVAVFGRTLFPTPPPMRVVWVNKRTSLSGEGIVVQR